VEGLDVMDVMDAVGRSRRAGCGMWDVGMRDACCRYGMLCGSSQIRASHRSCTKYSVHVQVQPEVEA
jgi:hypothetical protein